MAVAVAGCTSSVAGAPAPAPATSPAGPTEKNQDVFGGLSACQVLDQLNAGQGFRPGENISRRNECTATKSGFGGIGLALDPAQGLPEFRASDPSATEMSINGRRVLQAHTLAGTCSVAIEVGQHSRAMVTVTMASSHDDAQACSNAQNWAERLEPLLPKVAG
nr:DUF3558 domain-containing protein [Amycolatopsis granulosa]